MSGNGGGDGRVAAVPSDYGRAPRWPSDYGGYKVLMNRGNRLMSLSSVLLYLVPPIWRDRAHFRSRLDGSKPHTQHVRSSRVGRPE